MNNLSIKWNEGTSNFFAWGLYYDEDYFCSVAIDSTTINDTILVYDRNGSWTKYKDLNAYCLTIYNQDPYLGSADDGTIARFQASDKETWTDYTGNAISSYWISKDFDLNSPLRDKTITRYYITAEYGLNAVATFEYGVERGDLSAESFSGLDLDLYPNFYKETVIPSSLTYKRGVSNYFKFSDSTDDNYFRILSIGFKGNFETEP